MCTPVGSLIYSNSRVHGNRTLGVVSISATTTTNYYGYNINCDMVPWIAFSQGCREKISGLDVITAIYIYISLLLQPYKLSWLFSFDAARSLEDASLR